jgi:HK97 family phage prohead protease
MKKKRNDYFLQRVFSADVRAAGTDGENTGHIIEGLAAVYEKETRIMSANGEEFIEIIRAGAFDETDFDDVKFLINHDFNGIALARSRRNNKSNKPNTMQLYTTKEGLCFKADLDTTNNYNSRALYSAVDRGDVDEMSFCFFVSEANERWSRRDGVRLREIFKVDKVAELSAVNFPAYGGTNINSRSLDSDRRALENARAALDNVANPKPDYKAKTLITMYKGR